MNRSIPFLLASLLLVRPADIGAAEPRIPEFGKEPNPEAVGRVLAGELDTARAAWWGFDSDDSTRFLQNAIDSGAATVIVPFMGKPWIVRPVTLRSHLTLLFEPGVVVQAKRGEFHGGNDCLFRADDQTDITLRGYGARLAMWKEDYQSEEYRKAEWRMGISLRGCSDVTVEGLSIEKTGGDGVYIGATQEQPFCRDVTIRDVECVDNHRQGISVISAENLLIENCLFAKTDGTAPQAGIDLEPNGPDERLVNCVIRNCVMKNNTGAGIQGYLGAMARKEKRPKSISVLFENCLVESGKSDGILISGIKDTGPEGILEFRHCTVRNTKRSGLAVGGKSALAAKLVFVNCSFADIECAGHPGTPIIFDLWDTGSIAKNGGIEFDNCSLWEEREIPVLYVHARDPVGPLSDVSGTITLFGPASRSDIDWKVDLENVELRVKTIDVY